MLPKYHIAIVSIFLIKTYFSLLKGGKTKHSTMQIVGCSLFSYPERGNLLIGKVTFSDGKDEYMMFLRFNLIGDECKLIKYQMQKGAVVGF